MKQTPMVTIKIHPSDNVVVARINLTAKSPVNEHSVVCKEDIAAGHKLAISDIPKGTPVIKYGHPIGLAEKSIQTGEHVHVHNLSLDGLGDVSPSSPKKGVFPKKINGNVQFNGFIRSNDQVGTRNYVGVLALSNCSASVTRQIARTIIPEILEKYPHVDGVVPLCHSTGCGIAGDEDPVKSLRRTMAGYLNNPNFGGAVMVGLGCEYCRMQDILAEVPWRDDLLLENLIIQEEGGTKAAVTKAVKWIHSILPQVNRATRSPASVSHLSLGLQCGGSDGFSGITANPALGAAADILVSHGGTAVLGETPEINRAEYLLIRRARTTAVGDRLARKVKWWQKNTAKMGAKIDNNPSPGNKKGGLTNIAEKALGAISKGGCSQLNEVLDYGSPIHSKGLVFMDSPGYDPASVTGMVAGGVNMVCFTTGCGSVYGNRPVPVLKLASNSELYRKMTDDMDINCGVIADGDATIEQMGQIIFEKLVNIASGQKTKSELAGVGDDEFVPWYTGAML
ncbi:MAG: altronate dehydratase family protein [Desulfobacterales bacterium]|nr:altronate dehydratase family protein [Desulfobacterales bacterium]